ANYLALSFQRPLVDDTLVALDALLGFDWPSFMALAAQYPSLSLPGALLYISSLFQFAIIITALGLTGRTWQMHEFVIVKLFAGVIAIGFWSLFPSFGPTAYFGLSPEIEAVINPVVDSAYGRELLALHAHGPGLITPTEAKGLIAFPSFHTVMALTAIIGAWHVPWLRWPFLVINLAMLPAIIVHGGHHLVDLIGGALTVVFAMALTHAVLRRTGAFSSA
ncbi:MAG: phosphatase PAP2 family protein, partial [Pseudomonadota bacterium]